MLRLPASLERRLKALFPEGEDRERFVVDALEEAIIALDPEEDQDDAPAMVGGTLHLFTDGGSRGNPGDAAIGCVLEDPARGVTLEQKGERIGMETNNVAEYRALIEGLKMAEKYQPNRLICLLDSELIVKQMNGEYRVKMPALQPLHEEVKQLSLRFADIVFKHIPRSDNHRADALVNRALDTQPDPRPRPRDRLSLGF
jgi:ribonuclease HI